MRCVYFGSTATEKLGRFFENYRGNRINDLAKRALVYRRMREFLTAFDMSDSYMVNGKKYVDIEDICIVEYVMRNESKEILVTNIFFNEK
ncbi:MAG: hypothetical protein FWD02_06040 [Bacteroidales bacterium]|nr:hypothetical protein [Bacteroidales bacterium]